jgi:RNA polymerase sigma-70 factor (ECF subfamily)
MSLEHDKFRNNAAGSPEAEEDSACLAAVARGDRAAFDRLYKRYYERVFRFSLRVTGRVNLVDDVISETMLVVWRKARDYRAASAVSTWIFGIAYRKSLKALAREGRPGETIDELPETELQAADTLDREAVQAAVRQAIAALPPEHRAVVELTFHFDRSYEDIAEVLGCPVGTVKSRMFHARAKLRPLLARLLGD